MYYVIQSNTFQEAGHFRLIDCLEKFDIPFEVVQVWPYLETFEYVTKRTDVFIFGALKLARLSKSLNWNPGAVITPNHDYEVYSKYYKENLLNYDSRIFRFGDDFEWIYDQHFIRPCLDSKVFTGKVYDENEWNVFKERCRTNGHTTSLTEDTKIQVAVPKALTQEIRFWIVDGKIVTQSLYRRGCFLTYSEVVDNDAIEYANKMIDIFQLAKTFVLDIGLTRDGWRIIECGSTACAGFYAANMQKLIFALEEAYN